MAEEAQAGSKMLPTLNTVERCSNTATNRSVREMLVIQCHSGFCYTVPQTRAEKGEKEEAAVEGETNDSENSFALGQMRQV